MTGSGRGGHNTGRNRAGSPSALRSIPLMASSRSGSLMRHAWRCSMGPRSIRGLSPEVGGLDNGSLAIVAWSRDGTTLYAGGQYRDGTGANPVVPGGWRAWHAAVADKRGHRHAHVPPAPAGRGLAGCCTRVRMWRSCRPMARSAGRRHRRCSMPVARSAPWQSPPTACWSTLVTSMVGRRPPASTCASASSSPPALRCPDRAAAAGWLGDRRLGEHLPADAQRRRVATRAV